MIYRAKDPTVAGLGFAAMRDIGAFLRNAPQDDFGAQNPVYRPDNVAIVEGTSQGGPHDPRFPGARLQWG